MQILISRLIKISFQLKKVKSIVSLSISLVASPAVSLNKQNVSLTNSTQSLQNFTAGKQSFRFLAVRQVQTFIIAFVPRFKFAVKVNSLFIARLHSHKTALKAIVTGGTQSIR